MLPTAEINGFPHPDLNLPQSLLDSIPYGVLVTDTHLNLMQMNKWVVQQTGVDSQATIGKPLAEVFPELAERNLLEAFKLVMHGGMPMTLSNRIHHYFFRIPSRDPSQREMPQNATISALRSSGKIIGTVTFISDMSERVKTEANLQQEVDKLNMLHEIDHAVSTLDLNNCLKIIVDRTRMLFNADSVTLYLFEYDELTAAAYDTAGLKEPVDSGLADWVALNMRKEYVPSLQQDERFLCQTDVILSEMAAPLIVKGNCIGVLDLQSSQTNVYNNDDLELLDSIATRAAISIHNARLHASERTQRELAESLRQISMTLAAELDVEIVLDSILKYLDKVVPYDAGCIALYENSHLHFTRLLGFELGDNNLTSETLEHYLSTSELIQYLEFTGQPQILNHGIPGQNEQTAVLETLYIHWAGAPIIIRGKLIGHLLLAKKRSRIYDEGSLEHLAAFANAAGIALENARLYTQQHQLATTDGLTGLTNRRRFDDELSREMERVQRYKRPTSLIMIDIDNFKQYNDTYGHPAGDVLLRCLADTLRQNTREVDILARYGGEEFALILPEVGVEGARQVAERIRLSAACGYDDQKATPDEPWKIRMPITISLGIAAAPEAAFSPAELIHAADTALYNAKRNGKNQTITSSQKAQPFEPSGSGLKGSASLANQ